VASKIRKPGRPSMATSAHRMGPAIPVLR